MAWNPSPQVAAVRDAAKKLNSKFAVIVYVCPNGSSIGMASYGATMPLCAEAGKFGKYLLEQAEKWGTAE